MALAALGLANAHPRDSCSVFSFDGSRLLQPLARRPRQSGRHRLHSALSRVLACETPCRKLEHRSRNPRVGIPLASRYFWVSNVDDVLVMNQKTPDHHRSIFAVWRWPRWAWCVIARCRSFTFSLPRWSTPCSIKRFRFTNLLSCLSWQTSSMPRPGGAIRIQRRLPRFMIWNGKRWDTTSTTFRI